MQYSRKGKIHKGVIYCDPAVNFDRISSYGSAKLMNLLLHTDNSSTVSRCGQDLNFSA